MIELITIMFMYSPRKEQRPLHRRVLGVEAGDQLALGFRQVERRAVRLGERCDQGRSRNGTIRYQWKMPQFGSHRGVEPRR